jgi:retron-type reverse transcriptase
VGRADARRDEQDASRFLSKPCPSRGYQPLPLRRVYIPKKSDRKTQRPLGIPTLFDRAQQSLHRPPLDPVVETTADKNSYWFGQQRSCADAIGQCFNPLSHAPNTQWIPEADVKNCFDKISHDWQQLRPAHLGTAFNLSLACKMNSRLR